MIQANQNSAIEIILCPSGIKINEFHWKDMDTSVNYLKINLV